MQPGENLARILAHLLRSHAIDVPDALAGIGKTVVPVGVPPELIDHTRHLPTQLPEPSQILLAGGFELLSLRDVLHDTAELDQVARGIGPGLGLVVDETLRPVRPADAEAVAIVALGCQRVVDRRAQASPVVRVDQAVEKVRGDRPRTRFEAKKRVEFVRPPLGIAGARIKFPIAKAGDALRIAQVLLAGAQRLLRPHPGRRNPPGNGKGYSDQQQGQTTAEDLDFSHIPFHRGLFLEAGGQLTLLIGLHLPGQIHQGARDRGRLAGQILAGSLHPAFPADAQQLRTLGKFLFRQPAELRHPLQLGRVLREDRRQPIKQLEHLRPVIFIPVGKGVDSRQRVGPGRGLHARDFGHEIVNFAPHRIGPDDAQVRDFHL